MKYWAIFTKDGKMLYYIGKTKSECISIFCHGMYTIWHSETEEEYWKELSKLGYRCKRILITESKNKE